MFIIKMAEQRQAVVHSLYMTWVETASQNSCSGRRMKCSENWLRDNRKAKNHRKMETQVEKRTKQSTTPRTLNIKINTRIQ